MNNILFCGNGVVFDGVVTCMLSILEKTSKEEQFTIYIYTMSLPRIKEQYLAIEDSQIEFIDKVVKQYNPLNKVIKIDVTDIYENEFAYCPNENAYCTPYTLIRLFADLVDGMPDKLLYLDVDIMFNDNFKLLYDIDLTDYEYSASRDNYGRFLVHPNYINAGVLLLNLKKIKETKMLEKARELIKTKKLPFADQSAIIRSTTKRKLLPKRFNDQKKIRKNTVVRHFSKRLFWLPYPHTDNIKQWHIEKVHKVFKYHQFDDIFDKYLKLKKEYGEMKK